MTGPYLGPEAFPDEEQVCRFHTKSLADVLPVQYCSAAVQLKAPSKSCMRSPVNLWAWDRAVSRLSDEEVKSSLVFMCKAHQAESVHSRPCNSFRYLHDSCMTCKTSSMLLQNAKQEAESSSPVKKSTAPSQRASTYSLRDRRSLAIPRRFHKEG